MSGIRTNYLPDLNHHQQWQIVTLMGRSAEWRIDGETLVHEGLNIVLTHRSGNNWLVSHNDNMLFGWVDNESRMPNLIRKVIALTHDSTDFDVVLKLYLAEEEAALAERQLRDQLEWDRYAAQSQANQTAQAQNVAAANAALKAQLAAKLNHATNQKQQLAQQGRQPLKLSGIAVKTASWTGR